VSAGEVRASSTAEVSRYLSSQGRGVAVDKGRISCIVRYCPSGWSAAGFPVDSPRALASARRSGISRPSLEPVVDPDGLRGQTQLIAPQLLQDLSVAVCGITFVWRARSSSRDPAGELGDRAVIASLFVSFAQFVALQLSAGGRGNCDEAAGSSRLGESQRRLQLPLGPEKQIDVALRMATGDEQ